MVKYKLGTLYPLDIKEESIKQMTMEIFHLQDQKKPINQQIKEIFNTFNKSINNI